MDHRTFLNRTAGTLGSAVALGPSLASDAMPSPAYVDKKIRVGVIGCGSVSGMYLPHLSKSPYVEIVSVCDRIPERAEQQGAKFNVPNRYPSMETMLAGAPFDLLVNLTDVQEHGHLNRKALE